MIILFPVERNGMLFLREMARKLNWVSSASWTSRRYIVLKLTSFYDEGENNDGAFG